MVKEIWKDVMGYEGLYQVSNMGRVRSLDRYIPHSLGGKSFLKGRILSTKPRKNGRYCRPTLYKDGVQITASVHRLVAQAFIPNPENKPQVNHINGIRTDNRVENLEWCTAKENDKHAWDIGLKNSTGSNQSNAILHEDDIPEIRRLINTGMYNREIADLYGVDDSTISLIRTGKHWKHVNNNYTVTKLNTSGINPLDNVEILPTRKTSNKISTEDVVNIKLLIKAGVRNKYIIEYYGIKSSTFSSIKSGVTWSNIKV